MGRVSHTLFYRSLLRYGECYVYVASISAHHFDSHLVVPALDPALVNQPRVLPTLCHYLPHAASPPPKHSLRVASPVLTSIALLVRGCCVAFTKADILGCVGGELRHGRRRRGCPEGSVTASKAGRSAFAATITSAAASCVPCVAPPSSWQALRRSWLRRQM